MGSKLWRVCQKTWSKYLAPKIFQNANKNSIRILTTAPCASIPHLHSNERQTFYKILDSNNDQSLCPSNSWICTKPKIPSKDYPKLRHGQRTHQIREKDYGNILDEPSIFATVGLGLKGCKITGSVNDFCSTYQVKPKQPMDRGLF